MPEELKIITDDDIDFVKNKFHKILSKYQHEVDIYPNYDSSMWRIVVRVDVPYDNIAVIQKQVFDMLSSIEKELQAIAEIEFYAPCKCGNMAFISRYDCDNEYQCDECRKKVFISNHTEVCRVCNRVFKPYVDGCWRTNLEVHVYEDIDLPEIDNSDITSPDKEESIIRKEEQQKREHAQIYEIDYHYLLDNHHVCSLECAKKQYANWLHRVLKHPFTQECLRLYPIQQVEEGEDNA